MRLTQEHLQLVEYLDQSSNLDAALQAIDRWTRARGYEGVLFGFAASVEDLDANLAVLKATLPDSFMDVYHEFGGVRLDPMARHVAQVDKPVVLDIDQVWRDPDSPKDFKKHPLLVASLDHQIMLSRAKPIHRAGGAFGTVNFFTKRNDPGTRRRLIDNDTLGVDAAAEIFFLTCTDNGLLSSTPRLTGREQDVIAFTAKGYSADDLSERWKVNRRTVEKRLANARRKLNARTTAQAVAKAAVYGLL